MFKNLFLVLILLSFTLFAQKQPKLDLRGVEEKVSVEQTVEKKEPEELKKPSEVKKAVEEELVDSPSLEEADIKTAEPVKLLEETVSDIIALNSKASEEKTIKAGLRSKGLMIYAILLMLLVFIVMSLASLFSPKAKEQNQ